jgi:hypothetical protein
MQSLKEELAGLRDDREWCEYPLVGVLLLMSLAVMCGCTHIREIERWGRERRWELSARLGFRRNRMPSEKELRLILKRVDREGLESILGRWGEKAWETLKGKGLSGVAISNIQNKGLGQITPFPENQVNMVTDVQSGD